LVNLKGTRVIVDSTPASGSARHKQTIAVDESAISPAGWMTLDLTATRGIAVSAKGGDGTPGASDADEILSLGRREMAAAAVLRAVEASGDGARRDSTAETDPTRRAWRLAREARALARARGQLPQTRRNASEGNRPRPATIPAGAIIPVGGSNLQAFTPAQPFPRDEKAANDNRGRLLLMTALIVGISAGYAMTTPSAPPARGGYEVPAPLSTDTRITHVEHGVSPASGPSENFSDLV
jgi:hypothetical protein